MNRSALFPTLAEDELRDLKDALAELLDRGSVLGFESRSRDLYQRASGATLAEPLRAVLALLEMELVNDDRRLLLFARPLDTCQLLRRFNQIESLFVLALWRIYHEHYQQGRVGAVVLGLNDLYAKLRSYFPRLLQETPKPGFFRSVLAMLAAFLRVYRRAEPGRLGQRESLGLVPMDEAFSKLSGDGVESCMETARALGLQLVLAMPDKDAPPALRGADTILVVTIDKRQEAGRTVIENWAHPARASDALAELEGM